MQVNNFIYTCSPTVSKSSEIYQESIFHHAETCLISLIHGMSSTSFGYTSLMSGLKDIKDFKTAYLTKGEKFFLDSGGYSIVSGQVSTRDINKFIECYNHALVEMKDHMDFAFQLDIPVFLNEPENSTKEKIYELNHQSLSDSISIINKHPELKEKFLAVLQFKIKSQYLIWDKLYNELEVYKYHKYYSVGGLVSLYGICPHVNFAPFIGPVYYWLYYYNKHSNFEHPFLMHILGTYHKFTRFIIFFIQELICRYLEPNNQTAIITYDSVNYTLSALYKARVGLDYYRIEDHNKLVADHSHDLDDNLLTDIYKTEECLGSYKENLRRIDSGDSLTDTTFLVPLNLSSQLNLDKFFHEYIKQYGIVDLLINTPNPLTFKNKVAPILSALSTFPTLTPNLVSQLKESLRLIHVFHHGWWSNDRDNKAKLDSMMCNFIDKIKFPFDLL